MVRALILLSVVLISVYLTEQACYSKDDSISNIDEEYSTSEASINFHINTKRDFIRNRLGSGGIQIPTAANAHTYKSHDIAYKTLNNYIPKYFDARKNWKNCPNIGKVHDQGKCDSSWAISTTSAFADRLCIATNGTFRDLLSVEELMFCCPYCGGGCRGGMPIRAWVYLQRIGVVTGGDYNTTNGCAPYGIAPCIQGVNGTDTCTDKALELNHICPKSCYGNKEINFIKDIKYRKSNSTYRLSYENIQKDVLTYGPIEASFRAYTKFHEYKKGVYIKPKNVTYIGAHSVKLIGWGIERGIPYWLLVNSWGKDWGMNGTFKIRRGTNECGIELSTTAGVPISI